MLLKMATPPGSRAMHLTHEERCAVRVVGAEPRAEDPRVRVTLVEKQVDVVVSAPAAAAQL